MTNLPLDKVGKRLSDLSELPEKLRKQLHATKIASKTNNLQRQILDVLSDLDGVANIDEILVGLYKKSNVIQQRPFLSNKLYRMVKSGHIIPVKGRKGVYKAL